MRNELRNFWHHLKIFHQGEARAVKVKILALKFGVTERQIREWTEELTVEHGKPIASSIHPPCGIFVAVAQEEKERYVAQLDARMKSLYRRRKAFSKVPLNEIINQLELIES